MKWAAVNSSCQMTVSDSCCCCFESLSAGVAPTVAWQQFSVITVDIVGCVYVMVLQIYHALIAVARQ
jgi:hypothetical protein